MKKVKRYIFSIGAPLAVIAPLAVAVSCGDAPKPQGERVVVNHRTEYVEHYVVKDDNTSELTITPVNQVQTVWSIAVSFAAFDKDGNPNAKFATLADAAKEIAAKVTAAKPDETVAGYQDTVISVAGAKVSLKDIQKIDPTIKLADFKDAAKIEALVTNAGKWLPNYIDLKAGLDKQTLDTTLASGAFDAKVLESIGLDAGAKAVELNTKEKAAATAVKGLITANVRDVNGKTWATIVSEWVHDNNNVQDPNNLTDAEKTAKSAYLIDFAKNNILNKLFAKITDEDQKALFNAVLADEDTLKVFIDETKTESNITDAFDALWKKNKAKVVKNAVPGLLEAADAVIKVFNGMHD